MGAEQVERLQRAQVLVCGLGGVGGICAELLVRMGIGHIGLVDNDNIAESNLNRQIIATTDNVGNKKVDEFRIRLSRINPNINIDVHDCYLKDDMLVSVLLSTSWDFVVDAIDTLSPKFNLLRICHENGLGVVSSMGSGGKTDPAGVRLCDISETYNCGLARALRQRLHKIGIYKCIEVVFSPEVVDKAALTREVGENKITNVGSISYMPNVFGCWCAYAAAKHLCGWVK